MPIELDLKKDAVHIANQLHAQHLRILKEIEDGELIIANLVRKAEAASLAPERALQFSPLLGGEPQCPKCWVEHGIATNLVARNARGGMDVFACNVCGHESFTPE